MRTGRGGTRPADAGQATASCSGGHLPATAVSAADIRSTVRTPTCWIPTFWTPTAVREQQRTAKVSAVSGSAATQTPAAVSGWGRTAADPQPPLRRDGRDRACRICSSALLICTGQVARSTQPAERLSGCVDTGHGLPNTGSPHARRCGHPRPPQAMGALRQRPRWTAGSRTVHHPATVSHRNGTPMCGTGQHVRLTARSVVWGRPES
jgi:hypothetical protein